MTGELVQRLDLRGLDPPEPMRRALEAVEALDPGQTVELLTDREPLLLHRELKFRGHVYWYAPCAQGFRTTVCCDGDGAMTDSLTDRIAAALKTVVDPELGYNIVDIGLVYDLVEEDGRVRVLLTTTTPGCPATQFIRAAVESCVAAVPGVGDVQVEMTWQPRWSPERMSGAAKAHFGFAGR